MYYIWEYCRPKCIPRIDPDRRGALIHNNGWKMEMNYSYHTTREAVAAGPRHSNCDRCLGHRLSAYNDLNEHIVVYYSLDINNRTKQTTGKVDNATTTIAR